MGYVWAVSKPVGKSLEGLLQVHVRTLSWQSYMFMYIGSKTTLSSSTESGFRNCSCDKGRGEIMYELDWVRCDRFQDQTCLILWFSLWIKKPCRVVKKNTMKWSWMVMTMHMLLVPPQKNNRKWPSTSASNRTCDLSAAKKNMPILDTRWYPPSYKWIIIR